MVVGLTGLMGSGKSKMAEFFNQQDNCYVQYADDLAKKALSLPDGQAFITERFGELYIVGGQVAFSMLAERVFADDEARQDIEKYVAPIVTGWVQKNFKKNKINVIENAILFEAGWDEFCDAVIFVSCHPAVLRERLRQRGMTDEDITNRLRIQMRISPAAKIKKSRFHVDNTLEIKVLERRVEQIVAELIQELNI